MAGLRLAAMKTCSSTGCFFETAAASVPADPTAPSDLTALSTAFALRVCGALPAVLAAFGFPAVGRPHAVRTAAAAASAVSRSRNPCCRLPRGAGVPSSCGFLVRPPISRALRSRKRELNPCRLTFRIHSSETCRRRSPRRRRPRQDTGRPRPSSRTLLC